MEIRFVYFDVGKVLFDFDYEPLFQKWQGFSHLEPSVFRSRATDPELLHRYERGEMETSAFFTEVADHLRLSMDPKSLENDWNSIFTPLEEHLAIGMKVSKQLPTGVISNISEAHIRYLSRQTDFFRSVPAPTYSYTSGSRKPDAKIYHDAIAALNALPECALFIDDMEANIGKAAEIGFQTIHLQPKTNLRNELERNGLGWALEG